LIAMLGLGRTVVLSRSALQPRDQFVVEIADDQLGHLFIR
jgi:hypothetical protein